MRRLLLVIFCGFFEKQRGGDANGENYGMIDLGIRMIFNKGRFGEHVSFDAQENQRMKKLLSQRERDIAILKQLESGPRVRARSV